MLIYTLKRLFCSLLNVIAKYLNFIDLQGKLYHFTVLAYHMHLGFSWNTQTKLSRSLGARYQVCSSTLAGATSYFCQEELQGVGDNSSWPWVI